MEFNHDTIQTYDITLNEQDDSETFNGKLK